MDPVLDPVDEELVELAWEVVLLSVVEVDVVDVRLLVDS